jgi:hypothetical protein
MYIYTLQTMPGYKAKFEGDTTVKYKIRRENTSAAKDKSRTDIRTDLNYPDAAAMVVKFNDKERESRTNNKEAAYRHTARL